MSLSTNDGLPLPCTVLAVAATTPKPCVYTRWLLIQLPWPGGGPPMPRTATTVSWGSGPAPGSG